jgi:phospholipid N-methyltransferase
MHFLAECGDFIRESRRHFRDTGALLPSSRFLAQALVAELHRRRAPARILEVGPGTGAVTSSILRQLLPGDHLDLVELNSHFVSVLEGRFQKEWNFWRHREQVRLIHSPLENLPTQEKYDFIISGLPLNNFPVDQVRTIYQSFSHLLKPGGTLSYFEYEFVRQLKHPFSNRQERRRLYRVGRIVGDYIDAYQIRKQRVLMNVPPAIVRHLRFQPSPAADQDVGDALSPLVAEHV